MCFLSVTIAVRILNGIQLNNFGREPFQLVTEEISFESKVKELTRARTTNKLLL